MSFMIGLAIHGVGVHFNAPLSLTRLCMFVAGAVHGYMFLYEEDLGGRKH